MVVYGEPNTNINDVLQSPGVISYIDTLNKCRVAGSYSHCPENQERYDVRFTVIQTAPSGFGTVSIAATGAREALDVVASMVERGATAVDVVDFNGVRYDLIELERALDDESTARD